MKPLLILCFCPFIMIGQKSAFWETKLFFEDGLGHKDSIIIGHDLESNGDYNPEYGEINIKELPWDSTFEVRASHNEGANSHASPKVLSKKIIGSTEAGLHPTYNCLFVREPIKFFVKVKNMPLKISWNKGDHENFCNIKNFLTPHILPQSFPNIWFNDIFGIDQSNKYVCLANSNQYIINDFNDVDNDFFEYILEPQSSGVLDTIHGFFLGFRTKGSVNSPCSGTVDVKDLTELSQSIQIFPNPTNSILKIDYSEPLDWTIMNIFGKFILSGNGNEIDVSTLFLGTYLLNIKIGNQVIFKKFVKRE